MTESMNELTDDELRATVEEIITVIGKGDSSSVSWDIMMREAEKVTTDIPEEAPNNGKAHAELAYMRMMLDSLESAYQEELDVANGGDGPTYFAG